MLKPGDVVFFKKVTRSSKRRSPEIAFHGNGFGVMLGIVPPGLQDPKERDLMMLMGSTGFLALDDVKEFLGEETLKTVIKKFEEKYYPKKEPSKLILAPDNLSEGLKP